MQAWEALLADVVNINSGTANLAGCESVRRRLIPEFEKLGFHSKIHDAPQGRKVLQLDYGNAKPHLLLVGHLDTVFPEGNAFQKFSVDGDKLRGPGVIDMKGGVVLMLELLAQLRNPALLSQIRILLNDDEEIGSPHSRETLKRLAQDIPYGLVLEPGLSDGTLVTSHSGVHWFEIKVKGRAAHAGLEHHRGVNAGVELGHKITQLAALTDYPKKVTVNLGLVSGGTTVNTVCEHASAKVDVRYVDKTDLDAIKEKIERIASTMTVKSAESGESPKAEVSILSELPSMSPESSEKLFEIVKEAAASVGQKVKGTWVGYASDANHLAQTGMQLLVGLGPYGDNMHTKDEYMSRASFEERLTLNKAIVLRLLNG